MRLFFFVILCLLFYGHAKLPLHYRQRAIQGAISLTKFQTPMTIFSGSGGTSTADSVNVWAGGASNRLTVGNASTVNFLNTISPALNICADTFFIRVTFYAKNKNQVLNLNRMDLYIGNDASNFKSLEFGSYDIDTAITYWGEWSTVYEKFRMFTKTGTFNCASIDTLIVGLRAEPGTQDTITMGEIAVYPNQDSVATVIINEDDQWDGWRRYAIPTLQSFGWNHNIFINYKRLGQANFSTKAQLDSLYALGLFEPGNHLYMHDTATALTLDSLKSSIIINAQALCAMWECSPFLAWPFGAHNRLTDSLVRTLGFLDIARTTKGNTYGEAQHFPPYSVKQALAFGNTTDTAIAKEVIDTLIAHRSVGIFLFHQICDGCTPADGNTWRQADFIIVMNYLKTKVDAGVIQVKTFKGYMERYGGMFSPSRRRGFGR